MAVGRNNAQTLQQRITAAASGTGSKRVTISGTWTIDRTLVIPSSVGVEVVGESKHGTKLVWTGPSDVPMFEREQCRDSVIGNFSVELHAPLAVFSVTGTSLADTTGAIISTNNRHENIHIQADATNWLGVFAQYGGLGYFDTNNEFNRDSDIYCDGVGIGVQYNGLQCKDNIVERCTFNGQGRGLHAIQSNGGSFRASHCRGGDFTDAFIDVTQVTDYVTIDHAQIENCERGLYHSHGPNGASMPTLIQGGAVRCPNLRPDENGHYSAIRIGDGGIGDVRNIKLGDGATPVHMICWESFNNVCSAHNVTFGAFGSSPGACYFSGGNTLLDIGFNIYYDVDGTPFAANGI